MDIERKKLNILVAIDEVPDPLWNRVDPLAEIRFVREGRETYRALTTERYDMMFLDLNIPGMDSLELLRRCRVEQLCPAVILTSIAPSFSYAQQGILYGVTAYLLRPLDFDEVEKVVRNFQSAAGTRDRALIEAAAEAAGHLRDENAADTFLRLGEDLTVFCVTAVARGIRWRDYYEAVADLAFQLWPWLKLYHHPDQYISLDYAQESDGQMVVNICLRKIRSLSETLRDLFPRPRSRELEEIMTFLLQSIDKNVQQKEVAEQYFITNSTLSSRFQRNLKMSYREYITTLKIRRGQYLLQYTDIRPEELAARLGYKDREHFAKLFRQRTGQTIREAGRKNWGEYQI